jgi:DNA-binding transcriptional LysR family regulator
MQGRTLWELKVFCAVIERNSFVTAARMLAISPSSATRTVQALETQLGMALLQRSQKRVALTAAGEVYYDYARRMLAMQAEAEEALADVQDTPKGWIRFSAPDIGSRHFFPAQIARLAERFPDVQIDVLYTDAQVDPIQETLDFAIRGAYPADSDLLAYPLWEYDRILCASPAYAARAGLPREPEQLAEHPLVQHVAPRVLKDWHFASATRTVRLHMRAAHRVNTGNGLLELVLAGAGVGRLASWVAAPYLQSGALVRACPAYTVVSASGQPAQMHAVYGSRSLPRRTRVFLDALRQAARQAKFRRGAPS